MEDFRSKYPCLSRVLSGNILFFYYLILLIVPNIALCFTEHWSVVAKVANVFVPLSVYAFILSGFRNVSKGFLWLYIIAFFAAFQIVLLYLFGRSVIAVDMFLNLTTTNPGEAMELLDNLLPALVIVFVLYLPPLFISIFMVVKKVNEIKARRSLRLLVARWSFVPAVLSLLCAYIWGGGYSILNELYPVNVGYNIYLAANHQYKLHHYDELSKNFSYQAQSCRSKDDPEIYVYVIGETSRADNWSLMGYKRPTNPLLSTEDGVIAYPFVLSQSNTTHKSVPLLMSYVTASDYDSVYSAKGIISAFKEAGFHTAYLSNQKYNHSFIDFFGKEADDVIFIKEMPGIPKDPKDLDLLPFVRQELDKGYKKLFIVLHTYGSHFSYKERYPEKDAFFKPDSPVDADWRNRPNLINAYDNSIRYTDKFLHHLIEMIKGEHVSSAMLYTSDHGEDIYDDSRKLFLHASPVPSYYQIHVPLIVWTSEPFGQEHPDLVHYLKENSLKQISSSLSCFQTILDLSGISTNKSVDSLSLCSGNFKESLPLYLNDHNKPLTFQSIGLGKEDFDNLKKNHFRYE